MTIGNNRREIDNHPQDSTNALFRYSLMNEIKDDIVLTSPVSTDDEIINVSPGHGFTSALSGERIVIWENNRHMQMRVRLVSTNALTIEYPTDINFTIAGAKVIRGNVNMNIDGSSAAVDFLMKIQNFTIPIDISKAILTMSHAAAGDDGTFGGIAELTKGVWFRKDNSEKFNLGNYKNNQEFKDSGAKVEHTAKGPGGTNATDITYDIKQIFGQQIRIDPRVNDIFRGQVRDALQTLTSFTLSMIGSYTSGE